MTPCQMWVPITYTGTLRGPVIAWTATVGTLSSNTNLYHKNNYYRFKADDILEHEYIIIMLTQRC